MDTKDLLTFNILYKVQYGMAVYLILHCRNANPCILRLTCLENEGGDIWETKIDPTSSQFKCLGQVVQYEYFVASFDNQLENVTPICWAGTTQVMKKSFNKLTSDRKFFDICDVRDPQIKEQHKPACHKEVPACHKEAGTCHKEVGKHKVQVQNGHKKPQVENPKTTAAHLKSN